VGDWFVMDKTHPNKIAQLYVFKGMPRFAEAAPAAAAAAPPAASAAGAPK
jgi:hypothetical protein